MRIQEMRSGVELLRKRQESAAVDRIFEMQTLLEQDLCAVAERFERELHIDEPETVATPVVLEAVATEPKVADAVCETAETTISSELARPMWAVVSFERVEVSRLTYAQAVFVMNELTSQGSSGLCIITDEAARRIARS